MYSALLTRASAIVTNVRGTSCEQALSTSIVVINIVKFIESNISFISSYNYIKVDVKYYTDLRHLLHQGELNDRIFMKVFVL